MIYTLLEDANAVILPAFAGTDLSDECKKFLGTGGLSILLGESREEYVARKMSKERRQSEVPETFHRVVAEAKSLSGDLLVAVDQEIGGICRLHDLAPQFPGVPDIPTTDTQELEEIARRVGNAAAELGVNCFLSPVLDVLTGVNPWLNGRTYSTDPDTIGRVSAAYVRGVQQAGIAATAKHFPGFHNIALDPAIDANAIVTETAESFQAGFGPFRDVIASQVEMIMVGPAIVQAFDPERAALRSTAVVDILKNELAFQGIVMADDLDSKATMRKDPLEKVAVDAVNAGCDFLLLADIDTQLSDVANALVAAAQYGEISRTALATSAAKMRSLAGKYEKSV
jgi:beta-N-acetylhexosaminidase